MSRTRRRHYDRNPYFYEDVEFEGRRPRIPLESLQGDEERPHRQEGSTPYVELTIMGIILLGAYAVGFSAFLQMI